MKPKTAIILLVVLALCVGYLAVKVLTPDKSAPPASRKLFDPPVKNCRTVTIVDAAGATILFEKRDGHWYRQTARLQNYRVDALVKIVANIEGAEARAADNELTGLDRPRWTVTLAGQSGVRNVLLVGREAPVLGTREPLIYVRAQDGKAYTVSASLAGLFTRRPQEYRDLRLTSIPTQKIVRIRIAGREDYELVKDGHAWRFVRPFSAKALAEPVEVLLQRVANISADSILDRSDDLAALGLDAGAESLVVTVWTASAPVTAASAPAPIEHVVILGATVQDKVYARRKGADGVYMVPRDLLESLQPKPMTLRDPRVLDASADKVQMLTIDTGGHHVVLARRPARWWMLRPVDGPANSARIQAALKDITTMSATSFTDEYTTPATFGLKPAQATVALKLSGDDRLRTLLVGTPTSPGSPMRFAKNAADRSIAVVKGASLKPLLDPAATWYDTTLLSVPKKADVRRIVIQRNGKTYTITRNGDGKPWALSTPGNVQADAGTARQLLNVLANFQADKIVILDQPIPEPYLKARERVTVALHTATDAASQPAGMPLTVARVAGKVYAWRPGAKRSVVGQCAPGIFNLLTSELRNRTVWTLAPADVTGISLLAGAESFELVRQDDKWIYARDPYTPIDAGKVAKFLGGLKVGRTDAFVAYDSKDLPTYRLDKPWFVLTLTFRSGRTLEVTVSHTGPPDTANRYVTASSIQGVFTFTANAAARLAPKLSDFKSP